jgi:hypothetical protein
MDSDALPAPPDAASVVVLEGAGVDGRLAPLDLDETARFIRADLAFADGSGVRVAPALGVSCLDQIGDRAEAVLDVESARKRRNEGSVRSSGPSCLHEIAMT